MVRFLRTAFHSVAIAWTGFLVALLPVLAQTWTPLNNQPPAGIVNCLLLTDAAVMCQSGDRATFVSNASWYKLTPDIAGSYVNGTWTQLASMPGGYVPQAYASAVLADGRVVVVGGEYYFGAFVLSNLGAIYDPQANTWTLLPAPPGWPYIGDAPSSVLPNGKYLVGNKLDARLALLDPATLTWTVINPSGKNNGFNAEEGWTLLPDGSVLTVDVAGAPNSERFLSSLSTWVTAGNTTVDLHLPPVVGPITIAPGVIYTPPGEMGPTVLRPDGTVFVAGGNGHTAIFTPPPANSTGAGSWARGPDFPGAIDDGPAALLPNGNVLFVSAPGPSFYEFNGTNLNPAPLPASAVGDASGWGSLLLLPTGQVMFSDFTRTMQIYSAAGTYNPSWAPTIASVPAVLMNGSTYQIGGTQFNGLSQGTGYGDESQNATNYPLVRIINTATGHVFYARTHGHSNMGVATGNVPVTTNFDVPAGMELGAGALAVVANGIPSVSVPVTITSAAPLAVTLACPAATGRLGIAYSSALIGSGGQPPFTFSILTGSLGGLTLTPSTGAITGTPGAVGVFSFTAKVVDSANPTAGSVTANCNIGITDQATAAYVTQDKTTHGSWKGAYGADGYTIAGDTASLAGYSQVSMSGQLPYTWVTSTQDVNCLQKGSAQATDRIAAVWYSSGTFTIDVTIAGAAQPVALYALDWDAANRVERIDVLDAASGLQLDTRTISGFSTGTYLAWTIKGHVQFKVTRLSGPNAIVSGVFFGGGLSAPVQPAITQNPANAAVNAGQTATFTVAASGGSLSYQWQSQASGGSSFADIAGANSVSYSTASLTVADSSTQFRCVATNSAGSATSLAATLTVTLSGPVIVQNPANAAVNVGQSASFTVGASGSNLTYQWQSQASGGSSFASILGANAPTYTTPPLTLADSGTQFRCVVSNAGGPATSSPGTLTVTLASANGAGFVTADTATKGTWKGTYGADGFQLASDLTSLPGYAQVVFTGQLPYVWSPSTQDVTCLQKGAPATTDRLAAVWYSSSAFTIDVNLSGSHPVALYALDWDRAQRVERVDVMDASTGLPLDSRTLSGFSTGTYLVWNVTGHVQFRVTRVSGPNAIVSGIFFGGSQGTIVQPAITQNPTNVSVNAGQTATFSVTASGGAVTYQWQSQASGASVFSNIAGATSAAVTTSVLNTADSGTQYKCAVSNSAGSAASTAATVTVTAVSTSSSAVYVTTDNTTLGAWRPTYGAEGYNIAAAGLLYPAYAQVAINGVNLWSGGVSADPRAMQLSPGVGQIACWYASPQFTVDLNLTDTNTHRIALYFADWGSSSRTQTVTIRDFATNTVLDTRALNSFLNGQYLVWNVKGHVSISIGLNSGPNAILSGLFFQ